MLALFVTYNVLICASIQPVMLLFRDAAPPTEKSWVYRRRYVPALAWVISVMMVGCVHFLYGSSCNYKISQLIFLGLELRLQAVYHRRNRACWATLLQLSWAGRHFCPDLYFPAASLSYTGSWNLATPPPTPFTWDTDDIVNILS
jgi:hypothetical protein